MGVWSRRLFLNALIAVGVSLLPRSLRAQAGSFLTLDEAPHVVFPEGTTVEQQHVPSTPQLREAIMADLGPTEPFPLGNRITFCSRSIGMGLYSAMR